MWAILVSRHLNIDEDGGDNGDDGDDGDVGDDDDRLPGPMW